MTEFSKVGRRAKMVETDQQTWNMAPPTPAETESGEVATPPDFEHPFPMPTPDAADTPDADPAPSENPSSSQK